MKRSRFVNLLSRGFTAAVGLLVASFVAVGATWVVRGGVAGGLTAAGRLLRHGPTDVYDFGKYPGRWLQPALAPMPFARITAAPPALLPGPDGRPAPLADILRRTRTLSFLVVRGDSIVFEHHAPGHVPQAPSQFFSVTKSILSTLVGMAVDDGLIRSIDQPVTDFVPELGAHGFGRTTLRQLLDMTSTLDYVEDANPFGLHVLMNYTSRLEPLILDFRLREGEAPAFRYKSGDAALLSLALQRALGTASLTDYAQRRLWAPLGMEDRGVWTLDREGGLEKAWCCIAGSARDLAKLGRLFLARGKVGNGQVLSERWIAEAAPRVRPGEKRPYSLAWWPASSEGTDFLAAGKDGQYLYVHPHRDVVIVRLGEASGYEGMSGWVGLFTALAAYDWRPR